MVAKRKCRRKLFARQQAKIGLDEGKRFTRQHKGAVCTFIFRILVPSNKQSTVQFVNLNL